jgi:S-adenosylmethionine hydrolase
MSLEDLGPPVDIADLEVLELPGPMVAPGKVGARVVGVDGFGNVQTNVRLPELEHAGLGDRLTVGDRSFPRVAVFSDVPEKAPAAIIDSQGYLAFVVNRGSAAALLQLRPGATVVIE